MHHQDQFTFNPKYIKKESISESNLCQAYDLGIIEYEKALQLQNNLVSTRLNDEIPDIILFLQHPSVVTIGLSGSEENVIASKELLIDKGIRVLHVDRGGDVTYHGPGQLVGYPIFDLSTKGKDIHQFVRNLEKVIIQTLDTFSIPAYHDSQYPGVWVGREKICALGIRVTRWVTKHGFALNVNPDLSHFNYITPCGIADREVTSIAQLLGHNIAMEDVTTCLLEQYAQVFNVTISRTSTEELNYHYAI